MVERLFAVACLSLFACGDSGKEPGWNWPNYGNAGASEAERGDGEETGEEVGDSGGGSMDGGEPGDEAPKLDLEPTGDFADGGDENGLIPRTCERAAAGESSVGCLFYTVDLDNLVDDVPFAVVVSNVQEHGVARVSIERKIAGGWLAIAGPDEVPALSLHQFSLSDFHHEGAGKQPGGAYRVVSDVPIVAYQFNPIDGAGSLLSDASMLYPVASWDHVNQVVNWAAASNGNKPFVTIAAAHDGTLLSFSPSVATEAGPGVQAAAPGQAIALSLDAGDTVSITPVDADQSLTGSAIHSDPEHPVAVFSGHSCANIPGDVCCCDHLEEQLSGVRLWGQDFVATHMPIRDLHKPEATLWQIYASEHGTTIELDRDPHVVGAPLKSIELDMGEVVELFVSAPAGVEADVRIRANRPIAVVGYMIGSQNLAKELQKDGGDPAMVQIPPVEQFLPRYVVLVPDTWINDALLLTRAAGASVSIDGVAVDDVAFAPVGDGDWEVARVPVSDGVHSLDGDGDPFGVVVVGWDHFDSYAYLGGIGTAKINPQPEG